MVRDWRSGNTFLARIYLGQVIDIAGWIGIGFIVIGLMIIAQFSNIDT